MTTHRYARFGLYCLFVLQSMCLRGADPIESVDVCIYGATPAGIVAAVTAKQEGRTVLLIEPGRWLGGILGAGLKPMQDCPEPRSVGGLTKEVIFNLGKTPPEIRAAFAAWIERERIPVLYEQRVIHVEKSGRKITKMQVAHAPPGELGVPPAETRPGTERTVSAKVFIDSSYEGDLMALAGVRYATGRESRDTFNESPAGVNPPTNWTPIDPYVRVGDPKSGLIPLVDADHGRALGDGDDYTQAYNFRYYVTSDPAKRQKLKKPENYEAAQFELVGRYVEYLVKTHGANAKELTKKLRGIFPGWPNSGDFNYERQNLVSIAPLGITRHFQDGSWAVRSRIWREHIDYLSGLHHFLSTDPRVPLEFRQATAELGLDRTMHEDNGGWPHQLYVRISRRMVSDYIVTHADVLNHTRMPDSIGLSLYGVDTYPTRRYAAHDPKSGRLGIASEGNMFIGGARGTGQPYQMPYRAIMPKAEECTNLLVPVCFSASYIAYASARMEPVFCVLGESAGVAAAQAIAAGTPVQEVDVGRLQRRLLERGQVLEWVPAAAPLASAGSPGNQSEEHLWLQVKGKQIVAPNGAGGEQPFIPVGIGYARDVIIRAQDDAVMAFCKARALNTVRLSFYTQYFNSKKDRPIDIAEHIRTHIEPVMAAARKHDLYVILNDHEFMSAAVDEATAREKQKVNLWDEATIAKWIAAWVQVAEFYKNDPRVLGYELMNEPHGISPETARSHYIRCIRAIRAVDRRHILIVGNHNWSHARSMEATWGTVASTVDAPYNNVVFAFHDYPGDNHPWIVKDHVTRFRDTHGVPVMCTEFGATHWNKGETACREFLAGMHVLFAQQNIGWMIWALKKLEDNPRNPYNEVDKVGLGPPGQFDSCPYSDLWIPSARIMSSPMPKPLLKSVQL